jgi:hypothetical protein
LFAGGFSRFPPPSEEWNMELLAHFTPNEIVFSLAIYLTGVLSGVFLTWASRARR